MTNTFVTTKKFPSQTVGQNIRKLVDDIITDAKQFNNTSHSNKNKKLTDVEREKQTRRTREMIK